MLTPPDILFVNYIVKRDNSSVIISIKKWIPYMYLIGAAAFIVKQCNCVVYRSSTGAIRRGQFGLTVYIKTKVS